MKDRMKPLLIIPRGALTPEDVARLNENCFCVVEADDPSAIRFNEPPPQNYDAHDAAALELFRVLMDDISGWQKNRTQIAAMYVDILLAGRKPKHVPRVERVKKNALHK